MGISHQGITKGQKFLPWNLYEGYQIKSGLVIIRQQGKRLNWSSIPVRKLPNLLVFVALMDYLQRGYRQGARV